MPKYTRAAIAATAVLAAGAIAGCADSTSSSSTTATHHHHKQAKAATIKLPKPKKANAMCAPTMRAWNKAANNMTGDENATADNFTELSNDVSALGLAADGRFLGTFARVWSYDAEGEYTPAQERKAVKGFISVVPKLHADILSKCPGYSFGDSSTSSAE